MSWDGGMGVRFPLISPSFIKTNKSRNSEGSVMVHVFNVNTKESSDGKPVISLGYIVSAGPVRAT